MSAIASPLVSKAERTLGKALPPWWLVLVTGIAWIVVGVIVLRFDYTSVSAISILFGCVAIAAGILEIGVMMLAAGWWKLFQEPNMVTLMFPSTTYCHSSAVGCQCNSRSAPGSRSRITPVTVLEMGNRVESTRHSLPPL